MKRLFNIYLCFINEHKWMHSVADGCGGLTRYFLTECRRCGAKSWERKIKLGSEEQKERDNG